MSISTMSQAYYRSLMEVVNSPAVKKKYIVNGDGDTTDVYIAQASQVEGGVCLRQRFVYASKGVLSKTDFTDAVWQAVWDI